MTAKFDGDLGGRRDPAARKPRGRNLQGEKFRTGSSVTSVCLVAVTPGCSVLLRGVNTG